MKLCAGLERSEGFSSLKSGHGNLCEHSLGLYGAMIDPCYGLLSVYHEYNNNVFVNSA